MQAALSAEVAFTKSKANLTQFLCNEAITELKIEPNACKPPNYHVTFVPLRSSPTAETAVEVAHPGFKKPAPLPGPLEGVFPLQSANDGQWATFLFSVCDFNGDSRE